MSGGIVGNSVLWNTLDASQVKYKTRDRIKIIGNYALGRVLGEGSYGKVKEGVHIPTSKRVAIKIYAKRHMKKINGGMESAMKEIEIMKSLHHPNVVGALDDFKSSDEEKLYVVIEYVNGGTLQDLLDRAPDKRLPIRQVKRIFKSLIKGLIYLEAEGVVHRDIKPDNLLLTSEGHIKIGDFGVAVRLGTKNDTEVLELFRTGEGSVAFQPPECQEFSPRPGSTPDIGGLPKKKISRSTTQKLDVWSAGVVLYIMITGKYPFENPNIIALFANIARGEFQIPSWITDEEIKDLLKGTLEVNPEKRLSLSQIKKHGWMKSPSPKESMIPISPISSLFGHDNETLTKVLETIKNQEASDIEDNSNGENSDELDKSNQDSVDSDTPEDSGSGIEHGESRSTNKHNSGTDTTKDKPTCCSIV